MEEYKQFRRTGLSEMRPYVLGEDLSKISVSATDNPQEDMGMVARNPKDHNDQWYVARKYFEDNLEEVNSEMPTVKTTELAFGAALDAVKEGKLIARAGWNGKGMFVFMRPSDELSAEFIINTVKSLPQSVKDHYVGQFSHNAKEQQAGKGPDSVKVKFIAYLCMKAADGTIVNGWHASQTDMLAEDWEIIPA